MVGAIAKVSVIGGMGAKDRSTSGLEKPGLLLSAGGAFVFAGVFLIELLTPDMVSHALLNVSLVAISLVFPGRWSTVAVAWLATALSLKDIYGTLASSAPATMQLAEVCLGLILVWVAAALVQYRKRTDTDRDAAVRRARSRQSAVVSLALDPTVIEGNIALSAERATEALAKELNVARASVWSLSDDRQELRCVDLFEASQARHSAGTVLRAADYPRYFAALETGRAIDADDARTDPRTSEYTPGYLIPYGITSMLDACIRVGGRNFGVVCCEHVGPARQWGSEELTFAGEIADQVAQAVANADSRRAHEAVLASEQKYRDLVETSNDLIWSVDEEGCWTFANRKAAERLLGYSPEELVGLPLGNFQSAEVAARDRAILERVASGEPLFLHETEFRRKDGSTVVLSLNAIAVRSEGGKVVGITGIGSDVTERIAADKERRYLESQLTKAQKMEALGRLAGGIAHDFNNLLSVVVMNAELIASQSPSESSAIRNAEAIGRAARRGKELVAQILTFSRRVKPSQERVSLNTLVTETEQLIRVTLPQSITLEVVSSGDSAILADPGQMSQVLMNLCSNAVYAMRERGGTLRIETRRLAADKVPADKRGRIDSPEIVVLRVSDTGDGMAEETRARIFEPFFSTKPVGEGTGLGLAVVLGIVEGHGGRLGVESVLGQGTTFELVFPAAEAKAPTVVARPAPPKPAVHGNELVVFVDDEEMVLEVAKAALEQFGYRVSAYLSSAELLADVLREGFRGDILITDQTMPHMSGVELAQKVIALTPDVPVILCSGYDLTGDGSIAEGVVSAHVSKPYSILDLLKVIRSLLDKRNVHSRKVAQAG